MALRVDVTQRRHYFEAFKRTIKAAEQANVTHRSCFLVPQSEYECDVTLRWEPAARVNSGKCQGITAAHLTAEANAARGRRGRVDGCI